MILETFISFQGCTLIFELSACHLNEWIVDIYPCSLSFYGDVALNSVPHFL